MADGRAGAPPQEEKGRTLGSEMRCSKERVSSRRKVPSSFSSDQTSFTSKLLHFLASKTLNQFSFFFLLGFTILTNQQREKVNSILMLMCLVLSIYVIYFHIHSNPVQWLLLLVPIFKMMTLRLFEKNLRNGFLHMASGGVSVAGGFWAKILREPVRKGASLGDTCWVQQGSGWPALRWIGPLGSGRGVWL